MKTKKHELLLLYEGAPPKTPFSHLTISEIHYLLLLLITNKSPGIET